jgi:ribosome-associated protein
MRRRGEIPEGRELVEAAAAFAQEKLAENVTAVRVGSQSVLADWFLICEGGNRVHNGAIADCIIEGLERRGLSPWHVEGKSDGRWVLIDYSDVLVHIMLPEVRRYYSLETLWNDTERLRFR